MAVSRTAGEREVRVRMEPRKEFLCGRGVRDVLRRDEGERLDKRVGMWRKIMQVQI
jgi:hypothetical protein